MQTSGWGKKTPYLQQNLKKNKRDRERIRLLFKQAEVQVNSTERYKGIGHV